MPEAIDQNPPTLEEQVILSLTMEIHNKCSPHSMNTAISALLACLCSAIEGLPLEHQGAVANGIRNRMYEYTIPKDEH